MRKFSSCWSSGVVIKHRLQAVTKGTWGECTIQSTLRPHFVRDYFLSCSLQWSTWEWILDFMYVTIIAHIFVGISQDLWSNTPAEGRLNNSKSCQMLSNVAKKNYWAPRRSYLLSHLQLLGQGDVRRSYPSSLLTFTKFLTITAIV